MDGRFKCDLSFRDGAKRFKSKFLRDGKRRKKFHMIDMFQAPILNQISNQEEE